MNILICNDDGIESKGLITFAERLSKKHNVLVVAPSGNRSAFSHSMTIDSSIKVSEVFNIKNCKAYSISGTPVDCVKFAKLYFKDFTPDVVIAGINKGHNLGSDVLYSGTVSIACEASFFGDLAFAFSVNSLGESDF
jgi:5'-nucleotidase